MFARLLHLLLIAALLGCPAWCHVGLCCGTQEQADAAPSCRACCQECPKRHPPAAPAPCCPHDPDSSACQGICGGAVLEKTAEAVDTAQTAGQWLPLDGFLSIEPPEAPAAWRKVGYARATPGRFIRQLHMSFLC